MSTGDVEIDPVLHALGPLGPYACLQLLLYFSAYFCDSHQMFSYVFVGQDVSHRCSAPGSNSSTELTPLLASDWLNSTQVTYDECVISVMRNDSGTVTNHEYPCVYGMDYDNPRHTSIISEFDLVCGRAGLSELTQTLLALGAGLGAIVFPWLSDLFGRKMIMMVSEILMIAATTVAAFSPGYIVFAIVKFFIGLISCGVGLTGVTAVVESFPTSYRALTSGLLSTLVWVFCIATLSPMAYVLRDRSWRDLHLAMIGSCGTVVFMFFLLDEPIRWLVANGKYKQAEKVMKRAARMNRKGYRDILIVFHGLKQGQTDTLVDQEDSATPFTPNSPLSTSSVSGDVAPHSGQYATTATTQLNSVKNGRNIHTHEDFHGSAAENKKDDPTILSSNGSSALDTDTQYLKIIGAKDTLYSKGKDKSTADAVETVAMLKGGTEGGKGGSSLVPVETKPEEKVGFMPLLRHRLMRKNLLINWIIWFVDSLTYFGLYLTTDNLAVNLYLGLFLNAVVEGASGIFMTYMLNKLGRKKTVGIFQTTAAVGLIVSGVCFSYEDNPDLLIAGTVASLLGRMGIGGAYNVMFLYTPEMFPTNVRNRALGTSFAASTIGGMVAPYCNILSMYALWGPGVLFGCLNLLAVGCLLVLPESNGKELPQTVEDLENWYLPSSSQRRDTEDVS